MAKQKKGNCHFYGTATVGEKGQIVIPSGARKDMGIKKGEKLLVMKTYDGMLALATIDEIGEAIEKINRAFEKVKKK